MMTIRFRFAFLAITLITASAQANSVMGETTVGSSLVSETLSGIGGFQAMPKRGEDRWTWTLGLTHSTASSLDEVSGDEIQDVTNEANLGIHFAGATHFLGAVGYSYAKTPAEFLVYQGPSLSLGWDFHLGSGPASAKGDDMDDDFEPHLKIKANLTRQNYLQTFTQTASTTKRRRRTAVARPMTGTNELIQTATGGSITYDALRWFSTSLIYTAYSYNRDVARFLSLLDSSRNVASPVVQGMATTLTGLPESSTEWGLSFYIGDNWTIDAAEGVTLTMTDKTETWATKLKCLREVGHHWEVGLGDEYDSSTEISENLVSAEASYSF